MRVKLVQTSGVSIARSLCRTGAWRPLASNQAYTEERGGGSSLMIRIRIIVRKNRRIFQGKFLFCAKSLVIMRLLVCRYCARSSAGPILSS